MFRSIRWRVVLPALAILLLSMLGLGVYLSSLVRQAYLSDLEAQLTQEARLIGDALAPVFASLPPDAALDKQADHYARFLDARITLIAPDGTVLGESHEDRAQMDNHLSRPEVWQALEVGRGSSVRLSRTVGYEMMYVAVTVNVDGRPVGIVRVALPLSRIESTIAGFRWAVILATALVAILVGGVILLAVGRIGRPIRRLTEVTQRLAEGDLQARLLPTTGDEVGTLTTAFNRMADRLQATLDSLQAERSRLVAILENMADGVLLSDYEGRVQVINPAAARMLSVTPDEAIGRSVAELLRHHRLIELWQRCRERGEGGEEMVELGTQGPLIQVQVTPLRRNGPHGHLVLLRDLTPIRRLEVARRDLIANISHELRSPLASLKALVETLREGALEDRPAALRFLERAENEVDAMGQMVEELLELARIESGQVPLQLLPTPVSEVLFPLAERFRPLAERAGLTLSIQLPPSLPSLLVDPNRIRQVVSNLLHNAIKFTPAGGKVTVTATAGTGEVVLSVADTGVGISAEDLPRIFERFYKADRARSGGGTGLGLAIAKHLVLAHGGRIWAESAEGKGSTFYVVLPTAE